MTTAILTPAEACAMLGKRDGTAHELALLPRVIDARGQTLGYFADDVLALKAGTYSTRRAGASVLLDR